MKIQYVCEICFREYTNAIECKLCESSHEKEEGYIEDMKQYVGSTVSLHSKQLRAVFDHSYVVDQVSDWPADHAEEADIAIYDAYLEESAVLEVGEYDNHNRWFLSHINLNLSIPIEVYIPPEYIVKSDQ